MSRPSNDRFGVTFMLLAATAGSISLLQSIMSPVLPTLQRELDTTPNAVSWVIIAFLLTGAVGTPILARLGDMIGKVRTLRIALGAIVFGNLVSAIAPNIEILVLGRAIQGAGLCAFPLTFGILRDESPSDRIVASIGTMSSVMAVGGGLGAVLAGPVVALLGWRALFWLPALVVAVVALLLPRFVPESAIRSGGRINAMAASTLALWLVCLLLPLSQGTQLGWTSPVVLSLFAAAVVLFFIWITIEARSSNPLIDLKMMRLPAIWPTNLAALLFGASMFAVWTFLPLLLRSPPSAGYGFNASVAEAGWIILPMLVMMAMAGMILGKLHGRISLKGQLMLGAALVALGSTGFAFLHDRIWHLSIASAVFGMGLGFGYAAMTNLVVSGAPRHQTGIAAGMNSNFRTIGGAIGTAIMTAIVTAQLQSNGLPKEQGFTLGFAVFGALALVIMLVAALLPAARQPQGTTA